MTRNKIIIILNLLKGFKIFGFVIYETSSELVLDTEKLLVGEIKYAINNIFGFNIGSTKRILFYSIYIPYKQALLQNLNNRFYFFINKGKEMIKEEVRFLFYGNRGFMFRGRLKKLADKNLTMLIRQADGNSISLNVRDTNKTDSALERLKVLITFIFAKLFSFKKIHLLYEKLGEKYEESASVLFEEMIDQGFLNTYYILSKQGQELYEIDDKYRKYIVEKYSFKHYYLFFAAKIFLGTDSIHSAFEVRSVCKLSAIYMRYSKYYDFVFLQHGVMYAISIGSETRKGFRYGVWFPKRTKIIVSSKLEAKHFIESGNYPKEALYITGLPKFDKSFMNKGADKIAIMPTWRDWELSQMSVDPQSTGYYRMLKEMWNSIPDGLKDKAFILTHPSFAGKLKGTDLEPMLSPEYNYSKALEDISLLITDYSSISYDAFYRGANVIFWWKDKEECMKEYKGFLMMKESNIIGDICYNTQELEGSIRSSYNKPQKKEYTDNYDKIVEFSDRKNTKRLIDKLIKDKLIYKN